MRITGARPSGSPIGPIPVAGPATPAPAKAAAPAGRSNSPSTSSSAAANATPSVNALVALGRIEDDRERRQRMADGLFTGLSLLEELNKELAAGQLSEERLGQLSAWLNEAEEPAHPKLAGLMTELALRVAVELAKLGR